MWLNIQYKLFSDIRLRKLERLTGETPPNLIGLLTSIWFYSQQEAKTTATKDEILEWSYRENDAEIIDKLCQAGFLSVCQDEVYEIRGNQKRFEELEQWQQKTKQKKVNGGKARAKSAQRGPNGRFQRHQHPEVETLAAEVVHQQTAPAETSTPAESSTVTSTPAQPARIEEKRIEKKRIEEKEENIHSVKVPARWLELQTDFDRQTAEDWMVFAKEQTPKGRFRLSQFAVAITKMRHNFDMSEDQITFLLDWVQKDEFWRQNAVSPVSLLKPTKNDPQMTKLDWIVQRIKARKKTHTEKVQDAIAQVEQEFQCPEIIDVGFLEARP